MTVVMVASVPSMSKGRIASRVVVGCVSGPQLQPPRVAICDAVCQIDRFPKHGVFHSFALRLNTLNERPALCRLADEIFTENPSPRKNKKTKESEQNIYTFTHPPSSTCVDTSHIQSSPSSCACQTVENEVTQP